MLPEKSHDATLNKGSIHHKDLPLNIFEKTSLVALIFSTVIGKINKNSMKIWLVSNNVTIFQLCKSLCSFHAGPSIIKM